MAAVSLTSGNSRWYIYTSRLSQLLLVITAARNANVLPLFTLSYASNV